METNKIVQALPNENEIKSYLDSQPYYGTCTTENIEGIEQGLLWMKEKAEPIIATLQAELEKAKELLREFERGKNGKLNFQEINDFQDRVTQFLEAK